MKTARMMFPLMLALTSGCATTLDQAAVLRQAPVIGGDATMASDGSACVVTGEVRTIAPKAMVRSGIELVQANGGLAVGFNKTPYDAVAMTIDPSSAMTTGSYSRHSAAPIRHVTPIERGADAVGASIDADCKSRSLRGAVTISAKEPFVVGMSDDGIAWSACSSDSPRTFWHLQQPSVEDLSVIALADGGVAVVFRQGGQLWFGRIDSEKTPVGPLKPIAERSQLRTPTLAESGDNVLIVWTEQSSQRDRWSLAGVSVAPCGHVTPIELGLPMESAEGDAIQPALAAADAGHFLLVWTEGPTWTHQVRAVTLESHGRAVGPALRVSSGAESGWGRPALTADGRGAVVYLVPTDSGFAVAATPIACPLSPAHASRVAAARF